MTDEALEEIRRIEAALPADLGGKSKQGDPIHRSTDSATSQSNRRKGGGDFPTRDPTTGRWTGVAPPEQPAERRALARPAAFTTVGRPPQPRPAARSRRRLPGQTLPTIDEIRAYDGYQLGSSVVSSLARPPAPARRLPLPPIRPSRASSSSRATRSPSPSSYPSASSRASRRCAAADSGTGPSRRRGGAGRPFVGVRPQRRPPGAG